MSFFWNDLNLKVWYRNEISAQMIFSRFVFISHISFENINFSILSFQSWALSQKSETNNVSHGGLTTLWGLMKKHRNPSRNCQKWKSFFVQFLFIFIILPKVQLNTQSWDWAMEDFRRDYSFEFKRNNKKMMIWNKFKWSLLWSLHKLLKK